MTFQDWFEDFVRDKQKLRKIVFEDHSLQNVERYVDRQGRYWEFGFTFTRRLVLRSGSFMPETGTWQWSDWETRHDIVLSDSPSN